MEQRELEGRAALVTGGARRIGREIALALASAGAEVAITFLESDREARRTVEDLRRRGARAMALGCDVRQEKSVHNTIKRVVREFGGLDVVVNNAAVFQAADFAKISVAAWDDTFATNTRGPFLVSRAALPALRKRRGRIVNIGSLGGLRPWATHAHYCASKAALIMLTQVMAKALAPEIAVNCVAPGFIELGEGSQRGLQSRLASRTPMRRNGTGEEVARAVLFFAGAPNFITGQVLAVDGGLGLA